MSNETLPQMGQFVVPNAATGGMYGYEDQTALDDLVKAADAYEQQLLLREADEPNDALANVRGRMRAAVERTMVEQDRRLAADRASEDRKFLNAEGIAHREQVLAREREQAVKVAAAPFLRDLQRAEVEVHAARDAAERPAVSREDFNDAAGLASQLEGMAPGVGLPWIARIIADAAGTASGEGIVRELLPHLRSLHDGRVPGYRNADDLKVVIHQASRLAARPEREVAADRAMLLESSKWAATELMRAALDPDPNSETRLAFRTVTRDGQGGERPTLMGDEPVAERTTSSYGDVENWRPFGGIKRGKGLSAAELAALEVEDEE